MREIKFRVWDSTNKKMIYQENNVYIRLYDDLSGALINEDNAGNDDLGYEVRIGVNNPLMQYTGLKDKNGKEIYEGDILCCPHYPANGTWHYLYHEVIWDEKLCLWKAVSISNAEGKEITAHGNPMLWVYIKNEPNGEIIGNIYENPELLNGDLLVKERDATNDDKN